MKGIVKPDGMYFIPTLEWDTIQLNVTRYGGVRFWIIAHPLPGYFI